VLIYTSILGEGGCDNASAGNPNENGTTVTATTSRKKKGKKRLANDEDAAETAPVKKQRKPLRKFVALRHTVSSRLVITKSRHLKTYW
jgi:hypothetical protein